MDADLDSLATAPYVRIDDELKARPELRLWRPKVGIAPKLSDAELMTMAVVQVLLGFAKEAQWIRYASKHLRFRRRVHTPRGRTGPVHTR